MRIKSLGEFFRRCGLPDEQRNLLRGFNFGMLGTQAPPSVRELAWALGFDVVETSMSGSERGRLMRDPFASNGYRIEVNEADNVVAKRWTVLHEIIHAYLHQNDDLLAVPKYRAGFLRFYDADERIEEREANEYVEAIVFGEGALEGAIGLYGEDEDLLCRHFGVSPRCLEIAMSKVLRGKRHNENY